MSERSSHDSSKYLSDTKDKTEYDISDDEGKDKDDEVSKFGQGMRKFTNKSISSIKAIPSNFNKWLNS